MTITSWQELLILAAAGGFGGYTYWTFSTVFRALRARAEGKRRS